MRKTIDFTIKLTLSGSGAECQIEAESPLAELDFWRPAHELRTLAMEPQSLARIGRKEAEGWGTRIFDYIMGDPPSPDGEGHRSDTIRTLFHDAIRTAWKSDSLLSVKISTPAATSSGEPGLLHQVPWELAYDSCRRRFLATDPDLSFSRYLRQATEVRTIPTSGRLHVLASSACPADSSCPPLDLAREISDLGEMFRWKRVAGAVRFDVIEGAKLSHVEGNLTKGRRTSDPVHVWHHCGHGRFQETDGTGKYQLAFEAENPARPGARWVDDAEITRMIGEDEAVRQLDRDLHLAVLNVCHAADPRGLAPRLAGLGFPAVVGFTAPVRDSVAKDFSRELWRGILDHLPLDQAVQQVRRIQASSQDPMAFCRTILFLRTSKPFVFTPPAVPSSG